MSATVCHTCGTQSSRPDRTMGPDGKQVRMRIRKVDGRQVIRIEEDAGFDWKVIGPDYNPDDHGQAVAARSPGLLSQHTLRLPRVW